MILPQTPSTMIDFEIARARSCLYSQIREFFSERGYLEVETPVLSPDLIPERTIDCFETTFINEFTSSRQMYLIPSPEIYIKKLIAQGSGSVFEISKCFRNCEQLGKIHNPEFSMLEYYTVGSDERESIELTRELFSAVGITEPFEIFTMRDIFLEKTGLDLDNIQTVPLIRAAAEGLNLHLGGPESWDDTFNRIFCTFVEPSLPEDKVVVITDYPAQIECLAQSEGLYRRRWEAYINGIEVANCYLEERNPEIVSDYYRREYHRLADERSQNGKVIPDVDYSFADYFKTFPDCSGVAVGLDRLLMAVTGKKTIGEVLLFPF